MSEAPTYSISTLQDMARIPVEAEARFLSELPGILAEVRRVQAVAAQFNEAFAGVMNFDLENAGAPTWIDDDKGIGTVTVRMPDGEVLQAGETA